MFGLPTTAVAAATLTTTAIGVASPEGRTIVGAYGDALTGCQISHLTDFEQTVVIETEEGHAVANIEGETHVGDVAEGAAVEFEDRAIIQNDHNQVG